MNFSVVSPSRPTGPRAWSLSVEIPISAPRPNSAVGEAGAGIHHDGCGIDLREEAASPSVVLGDDGLRMRGPAAAMAPVVSSTAGTTRIASTGPRYSSYHRLPSPRSRSAPEHRPQGSPEARRLWPQGSRPPAAGKRPPPFVNQKGLKGVADPIAMVLLLSTSACHGGSAPAST